MEMKFSREIIDLDNDLSISVGFEERRDFESIRENSRAVLPSPYRSQGNREASPIKIGGSGRNISEYFERTFGEK